MKKYTKADNIKDLVTAFNEKRVREGKCTVSRCWTGAGHWLKTDEKQYRSFGGIYTSDDKFIGFLEGLLYDQSK